MGIINETKISEFISNGKLITRGFEKTMLKEVCYNARTSNKYFEFDNIGNSKVINIEDGKYFILRPQNQVVCVTKEYFSIPMNMIARIFLIGDYFSLGIAPVNTIADPGFKGFLGIVLTNTSKNYIKIFSNTPIAKIEFSFLQERSLNEYVGQYGGELKIWPFRKDLIADDDELKNHNIVPGSDAENQLIYGNTLASTINKARNIFKIFAITSSISALVPVLLIWGINQKFDKSSPILSIFIGVFAGVISNLISTLIINKRK
jgi:deoxycytidine triphosphate deaminase